MHPNTRLKNLRLNRDVIAVLKAMGSGQNLHMEFCPTGSRWRLSGGDKVKNDVARLVTSNPSVIAGDDALFPNTTSQTWRIK